MSPAPLLTTPEQIAKLKRERTTERHELCIKDAIIVKARSPELAVNVPVLILAPEIEGFLDSIASIAERQFWTARPGEPGDPDIAMPCTGSVVYTTIHGRLHRVTVEDVEMRLRPPVTEPQPWRLMAFDQG